MTKLLVKLFIKDKDNIKSAKVRRQYGFLSGMAGIFLNTLLFIGKLIAGLTTSSIAITADAFNNLSDAGSSVISLVGFKMAGKPADNEHPFGHGRMEYISGFIISIIIIIMGLELLKSSVTKIINPVKSTYNTLSIIILCVSIIVKLWMFLFNRKLGKLIDSPSMTATAKDSLSDTISTFAVLLGIIISLVFSVTLDGWLGTVVAAFILITGIGAAKDTLNQLLGEAPDKTFIANITDDVLSHPEILGIHDLIVHNYGVGNCVISLHAEVPSDCNILKIHDVIDNIENEINQKFNCLTVIHMDPIAIHDKVTLETAQKVKAMLFSISDNISMHDFRMVIGETHTNVLFDIVVPFDFVYSDEELKDVISQEIKKIDSHYIPKIKIDKQSL